MSPARETPGVNTPGRFYYDSGRDRRLGELMAEMDGMGNHGGNRKTSSVVKLEDLGISKSQSHRWQTSSKLPEPAFNQYAPARRNLSHDQLVKYLGYLTDQDLLVLDARRYRVTEKGTAMLDEVSQVIDLVRGLRGDEA